MFLRCDSELWCRIGGTGALPRERSLRASLELLTCACALSCHLSPMCGLTGYTVVGTALSPVVTLGRPVVGPGVSQALFSPGHQHRSLTMFRYLSPLWELWWQLRHWPSPALVCIHSQSPHLLRPDSSHLWEDPLSIRMSCRC